MDCAKLHDTWLTLYEKNEKLICKSKPYKLYGTTHREKYENNLLENGDGDELRLN